MLVSPTNNLIVSVQPKWIKHFSNIIKLASITDESKIHAEDIVNIVGTVVSIPKKIETDKREYNGFSTKDIRVGDTAIFSYSVIFDFGDTVEGAAEPNYRNRFIYKAKEYFVADITKVFGIIRDGVIIMINGYTMVEEYAEPVILLPQTYRKNKRAVDSKVMYICNNKSGERKINASEGDTIYFNPRVAQHYKINNKEFAIIQQNKVLGKSN